MQQQSAETQAESLDFVIFFLPKMCPWIQWEHAGNVPRDVTTTQQQRNNKIQQTQAESLDFVVFFLPEMCPWVQWEHAGKVPRLLGSSDPKPRTPNPEDPNP